MKVWWNTLVTALLFTFIAQAQAGVVVGGTRLVYDGGKKESSIGISNQDKSPYLIQSWVDTQEGDHSKAPFIITPPLFRLDGGENNILRVVRAGGNLPSDKESLYWLNIKSIPSSSSEKTANTLQIAVKTRIKLIYRPEGLPGTLNEAAKGLKWQRNGNTVTVTNTSPYYLTFFKVKVNGTLLKGAPMVAPQSNASFNLPASAKSGTLTWEIINDYGGTSEPFTSTI